MSLADLAVARRADRPLSGVQRGLLALLRAYKLLISPMFAGSCRFVPSCSDYAAEAIARFGAVRGCLLAGRRLLRCHPLGAHGLDPVPSPGRER
jgi:putative membrane protein insertion efficiency factor